MKKKILILSLVLVVAFVFAISVSAEEFSLTYYQEDAEKETVTTNENGEITLRDTGYSTETQDKTLLGWFTYEGDMYKPGETIVLTKDTNLYQFFGFKVTQKNFQTTQSQWASTYIQLQEDVVFEDVISWDDGGKLFVDLNGYTITSSAGHVFSQRRAGLTIVGEGSIIHTGKDGIFKSEIHGYDDRRVSMYIGKNVKIETPGVIYNWSNSINSSWITFPVPFVVYGDITCKQLMAINGTTVAELNIIVKPKRLVITGESLFSLKTYPEKALINVQIGGTTFELNESANKTAFWNNDNPQSYNISIVGGTFTNGGSIVEAYLSDEYTAINNEINGVTYTTVVSKDNCTHEYELTGESSATCIVYASKTYTCKHCNDTYAVMYGSYAEHIWELISEKQPTLSSAGVKEYECSICKKIRTEKTFLDIANETIKVTVTTADGEKEVSVKASDVFDLEVVKENEYKLKDIKAFGEYAITDIVAINVPLGIVNIDFASNNATLKRLVVCDGASLVITSFSKCTELTHIEIGAAEVTFKKGCPNSKIQSIKSLVEGASVVFEAQVFDGKMSITELKLSAESEYNFQTSSFHASGLKEVILPDNSNISWGKTAFAECQQLEYVYLGSNIGVTQIANDYATFDGVSNLKKVVIMDLTYLGQWAFSTKAPGANFGPLCDLTIYIHSENLTMNNNCLNNRNKDYNVYIYTVQNALPSGINNCNFTIYKGIPHAFFKGYEAPTCTEEGVNGYTIDCPCGVQLNGVTEAQKYVNSVKDYEMIAYESVIIPATGHKEGTVINIEYVNGYMEHGLNDYICSVCSVVYTELSPTAAPLYTFLGYSMPEDGRLEISIGFMINNEAINTYEAITENTVKYGIVLALEEKLNGKAPLDSEVVANTQSIELDRKYCGFALKVSGFTEANLDLAVVMAIYVTEGDSTVYLQETQKDKPTGVSINSLNS